MKKIKSYTSIWSVEKVIYAINDFQLPFPLTFSQMAWFVVSLFVVILFGELPPFNMIDGAFLKYFGIPVAFTWFVSQKTFDGKKPFGFLKSAVTFALRPKVTYAGKAIKLKNEERQALKDFYSLMKLNPAPMLGGDMYKVLYGSTFKFDKEALIQEVKALTQKIKDTYDDGTPDCPKQKFAGRPRIMVTGSPIGGASEKVIKCLEDNGAQVVVFENCSGAKSVDEMVDEQNPDIYDALARRYLNIGCSCMTPDHNRFKLMDRLIDEYQVDAVVEVVLQACHTYNVESFLIKRFVTEEKKKPYIALETDYSTSDAGQISTRLAAFLEML